MYASKAYTSKATLSRVSPDLSLRSGWSGQSTSAAPGQSPFPGACFLPCPFPSGGSKRATGEDCARNRPPHLRRPPSSCLGLSYLGKNGSTSCMAENSVGSSPCVTFAAHGLRSPCTVPTRDGDRQWSWMWVPPACPPTLTDKGGSVTELSHAKHSLFDTFIWEEAQFSFQWMFCKTKWITMAGLCYSIIRL